MSENEKYTKFLGTELGPPSSKMMDFMEGKPLYPDGRSPISNTSSSTEEGCASSSSLDNSSICSTHTKEAGSRSAGRGISRSNHSEVEKRRRRKINTLIDELADLVPTGCSSNSKADKLTVLKVAVQHLRILGLKTEQGCTVSSRYKPPHMQEKEMERLLESATKGFLFVIGTDRLQILHMSDKVQDVLNFSPGDLIGKRLFDVVHAKDVTMLKEQLTSVQAVRSTSSPLFLGSKPGDATDETNTTMCKRSFFCRFRNNFESREQGRGIGITSAVKRPRAEAFSLVDGDMSGYTIVHCTGFLKSLLPAGKLAGSGAEFPSCCYFHGAGQKVDVLSEGSHFLRMMSFEEPLEFSCRCSAEGRFLQVDPRMVRILGYLPQDLIGQNCYKYIDINDVQILRGDMEEVLTRQSFETVASGPYRMVSKSNYLVPVVASLFAFRNPLTNELEYIVQRTNVVK